MLGNFPSVPTLWKFKLGMDIGFLSNIFSVSIVIIIPLSTNDEVEAKIEKITEQAIAQKVLARLYEMFKRSEKEEKAIQEDGAAHMK